MHRRRVFLPDVRGADPRSERGSKTDQKEGSEKQVIRKIIENTYTNGMKYVEAAGLSTDSKPTAGIVTGSLFLEVDTGDVYAFAEGDAPAWNKIAELGGGA